MTKEYERMGDWKSIDLCGAADIERVCGVYQFAEHQKVPGGQFKIKVLESRDGQFTAVANVCLKSPDGVHDGRAGLGHSEIEALQNALKYLMEDLSRKEEFDPDEFYWTDPEVF